MNISKHLYEQSRHPKIKSGELYLVYFKDCLIEDELCDALGIFRKAKIKTSICVSCFRDDNFELDFEVESTSINSIRLFNFNTEADQGFKVCTVDKLNPSGNVHILEEVISAYRSRADDFYKSRNFIELCKRFSTDHLSVENNRPKETSCIRGKNHQIF